MGLTTRLFTKESSDPKNHRISNWADVLAHSKHLIRNDMRGRDIANILNYFKSRKTSGFVEGLNNKIKVLKRRCYGVHKITTLFQRLRLDFQGYKRFA